MKGSMNIHYDEEGDYLEIGIGSPKGTFMRDVAEGMFERVDEKTGKVTGIGVLSFKKRTENMKDITVDLPVKLEIT
jgi:uncharacterized protein YuzE